MGETLHAIVEECFPYVSTSLDGKIVKRDCWEEVSRWWFQKDYALMIVLYDHEKCHQHRWPADMSFKCKKIDGLNQRQFWFEAEHLPFIQNSPRYSAMVLGISVCSKNKIRVLFYTL